MIAKLEINYTRFLFGITIFVSCFFILNLSGCAYTTQAELTAAETYLKGDCKEAYLSSRTSVSSDGFGYQYHRFRVRAFAAANYGDSQYCYWWHGPIGTSQTQANTMALSGCNARLPRGLTCTVFAEGDHIVNFPASYLSDRPAFRDILFQDFCINELKKIKDAEIKECMRMVEKSGGINEYKKQLASSPDNKISLPVVNSQLDRKPENKPSISVATNKDLDSPTFPPVISSTINQKRVALVIGNASYKIRPLVNPRNDADDMSRALKNAGFEVIDVRDASLPQMRTAVRQFGDRLLTRDVGLVYYSGHGMEVRGRNYFIPVNADIKRSDEIADQSLDVNLILEKMETAKKGVNILIVDACRDDPFGRSFRSSSKGLATMDAPQGTIIAFATSPGKVAADGEGRNSPYTKNLIKVMQVPNLPIEQVFKQVRRAVQQETKNQQTPWENTSLSGDFYFSVKR